MKLAFFVSTIVLSLCYGGCTANKVTPLSDVLDEGQLIYKLHTAMDSVLQRRARKELYWLPSWNEQLAYMDQGTIRVLRIQNSPEPEIQEDYILDSANWYGKTYIFHTLPRGFSRLEDSLFRLTRTAKRYAQSILGQFGSRRNTTYIAYIHPRFGMRAVILSLSSHPDSLYWGPDYYLKFKDLQSEPEVMAIHTGDMMSLLDTGTTFHLHTQPINVHPLDYTILKMYQDQAHWRTHQFFAKDIDTLWTVNMDSMTFSPVLRSKIPPGP